MKQRLERLARTTSIANKIWRAHQMQLAQIEGQINMLRAAERATFEAIGRLDPNVALGQIKILTLRLREAEIERARLLALSRDSGRRMKLAEKLHEEAEVAVRQSESAESLRQMLQRSNVSQP